jgi:H+/Cl- antiporter ClcA
MDRKLKLILMVIHGVVGMSAGICGCAVFASKYSNINAAVWAGISAFIAFLYVQANRSVYRDVNSVISPQCFLIYIFVAVVFMLAGSVVMITYLVIGLTRKEGTNERQQHFPVLSKYTTTVLNSE